MVLLRPFLLTYRNRLIRRHGSRIALSFEALVILAAVGIMLFFYVGMHILLVAVSKNAAFGAVLPSRLIGVMFFGFLLLLTFSNFIAAISCFFTSKDLPLILASPATQHQLYQARLVEVILSSSWMFAFFGVPIFLAYLTAFQLPAPFLLIGVIGAILFLMIPATIGVLLAHIFINLFSVSRLGELIALAAVILAAGLILAGHEFGFEFPASDEHLREVAKILTSISDPNPWWLPSRWMTELVESFLIGRPEGALIPVGKLFSMAITLYALGYLVFREYFLRGWTKAVETQKRGRSQSLLTGREPRASILPFDSQKRAIIGKEYRSFLRDAAQALQLVLILLLTMLYLYNFHSLRGLSRLEGDFQRWWQVVLAVANIAMSSCVTSAIATRFVFPSISLEGQSYLLLRCAPLTIRNFLWGKFYAWLLPVSLLSSVLLLSGAFALQASPMIIMQTLIAGFIISIGVVGVGVGVGAVYARFDWDSPSQVTSSFGGLVYMVLSFMVTVLSLIPVSYLLVMTSIPGFLANMSRFDYVISVSCALFLLLFVNIAAVRRSVRAGESMLTEFEG